MRQPPQNRLKVESESQCNDCPQNKTVKVKVKVKDLIENRLKRFLECQLGKVGTEILTSGAGRRLSTFTTCHPETFQIQYYMFIECPRIL